MPILRPADSPSCLQKAALRTPGRWPCYLHVPGSHDSMEIERGKAVKLLRRIQAHFLTSSDVRKCARFFRAFLCTAVIHTIALDSIRDP